MSGPMKAGMAQGVIALLAAVDWRYAAGVALGLVAGWFCRAAVPYANRKPWGEVRRQVILSVMISGGSLIATLWIARLTEADALGAAFLAWSVAFGGLDTLTLLRDYVWKPVREAIGKGPVPPDIGEHRQSLAREQAARRLAETQGTNEQIEETLKRLLRAERRRNGEGPPLPSDVPPEEESRDAGPA